MSRRYVMGTLLRVQVGGEDSERLQHVFFDEVQRLERVLSIYRPESDIARVNEAAGCHPVPVSQDAYELIQTALAYAAASGGAFDPTLEPLGYRQVVLDPQAQTVFFAMRGTSLNLGGIGKGFALDRALAKVCAAGNPESVSADFGGQLFFWHRDGSFGPETILIEDPQSAEAVSGFQVSSNCSISTSSQAQRPEHLIEPRSGQTARQLSSVTVSAPTGTLAEVLSTAVFVMGEKKGAAWLKTFPNVRGFILPNESEN